MNKKIIILSVLGLYDQGVHALSNLFTEQPWVPTVAVGASYFNDKPTQTYTISNYIFDTLSNAHQHRHASFTVNLKKQLHVQTTSLIDKIMLGPAFYYQKAGFSGEVWELNLPEFFNYTYHIASHNYNVLVESDIYLHSFTNKIAPFITAGIGAGIHSVSYDDYAQPGISSSGELHLTDHQETQFVYALGAGLAIPITAHLAGSLRYVYTHNGSAYTSTFNNVQQPLKIVLNNQAVFAGISIIA